MIIPPMLRPGDKIGITCPAGYVQPGETADMLRTIQDWGFEPVTGQTVGSQYLKFSGTDEERLTDLQRMLDDRDIKAIFFGRGGYGTIRILDQLDFSTFLAHPKWLVGFSDITALHSHLSQHLGCASLHAHMCSGYKPAQYDEESTLSILRAVTGQPLQYQLPAHQMNRSGTATGLLTGGNLALLSDLAGSVSDVNTAGKILFIEDVGEYCYNVDRMLWQLKRAGKLNKLAGLIVGGFTDRLENDVSFGMTEYEIVWEKVKEYSYPVCFDFPVGHQPRNVALKCGVPFTLSVTDTGTTLTEQTPAA
jgi:muramoyltetrapeptide carboxypeptidase